MRTQEQWEKFLLPKLLKKLTPRQLADIGQHPMDKLPDPWQGLYIYGPVNTGKSTMAIQMWLEAQKKRYFEKLPGSVKFVIAYDFFEDIRKAQFVKPHPLYDEPPRDASAALAEYASAALLFLDDLGSTRFTEWQAAQLQILVDQRYEMMLPTVYTSNLSLEDLEEALGDKRTPSRIRRTCKLKKVKAT
jgi:DNA replication protein DnaC